MLETENSSGRLETSNVFRNIEKTSNLTKTPVWSSQEQFQESDLETLVNTFKSTHETKRIRIPHFMPVLFFRRSCRSNDPSGFVKEALASELDNRARGLH